MGFKSLLDHIGHDLKMGLDFVLPIAAGMGQAAVTLFVPALGPAYKATVMAVAIAEQKGVALGSVKSGTQKLADVLQLTEPVIAQALKDAGQDSSTAAVTKYIESVVTILKAAPAPSGA